MFSKRVLKDRLKRILPKGLVISLRDLYLGYGSGYAVQSYSQEGEDLLLMSLFENRRDGFYVDVGAHHPEYGIDAIVDHTNSFVRSRADIVIVTYEKLHEDTETVTRKILDYVPINCPYDLITFAVDNSSFSSMRDVELEKGRLFGSRDFLFTRSGRVGEGRNNISPEDREFVLKRMKRSPVLYMLYG